MKKTKFIRPSKLREKPKCYYCESQQAPSYKDPAGLEQFLTPRKKIMSRRICALCTRHQRQLAQSVKRARNLALI